MAWAAPRPVPRPLRILSERPERVASRACRRSNAVTMGASIGNLACHSPLTTHARASARPTAACAACLAAA